MIRCYRCDKRLPEGQRVFSSWTRRYYCTDLDGCQRRYERRLETDPVFAEEQRQLTAERLERVNEAHERFAAASAKRRR